MTSSSNNFPSISFSSPGSTLKEHHVENINNINNEDEINNEENINNINNNDTSSPSQQQQLRPQIQNEQQQFSTSISDFVNQKFSMSMSQPLNYQNSWYNTQQEVPFKCYQYKSGADVDILKDEIQALKYQINDLNKSKTIAEEYIKDLEHQNTRLAALAEKAEILEQVKRENTQLREDNLRYREMLEEAFCLMNKLEQLKDSKHEYKAILEMQNYVNKKNEYSQLISDFIVYVNSIMNNIPIKREHKVKDLKVKSVNQQANANINVKANDNAEVNADMNRNDTEVSVTYKERMEQKRNLLSDIENKRKQENEQQQQQKKILPDKTKLMENLHNNIMKLHKSVNGYKSIVSTPKLNISPLSLEISEIENQNTDISIQSPKFNFQIGDLPSNMSN